MNRIVVIGSSNADLVVSTDRAPEGGETVLGNGFIINHGGKEANQAVAVLRIGGNVSFISKVGNDIFGSQILRHFEEEGMDVSYNTQTCRCHRVWHLLQWIRKQRIG